MKPRLLIVEDHGEIRTLIRLTLGASSHDLYEAANGHQALMLAQQLRPQLVVLDVMMPAGLDGVEVCRVLKTNKAFEGPQVLLLTACGQETDLAIGKAAGADAYLIKPFSPMLLLETVERLLGAPFASSA